MGSSEVYRYERKFVVTETTAQKIRRFVAGYLVRDAHMAGTGPDGYHVHTLYLDTPQLALYRQSAEGIKNRYKLRIRFYDKDEAAPAFLEIKKRTTETVHKLRAIVAKTTVERLLSGGRPRPAELLLNSDASLRALAEFCDCRDRLRAEGSVFVNYEREAFVSNLAENVRVTLDRRITGQPYRARHGLHPRDGETRVVPRGVVLELKYNGRAPRWMHDLVTSFELARLSFPKYVHCVEALQLVPPSFTDFSFARSATV